MALLDTYRANATGLSVGGRINRALSNSIAAFQGWRAAQATRKELLRLSDHELDDIGLVRGDVDRIASRIYR